MHLDKAVYPDKLLNCGTHSVQRLNSRYLSWSL